MTRSASRLRRGHQRQHRRHQDQGAAERLDERAGDRLPRLQMHQRGPGRSGGDALHVVDESNEGGTQIEVSARMDLQPVTAVTGDPLVAQPRREGFDRHLLRVEGSGQKGDLARQAAGEPALERADRRVVDAGRERVERRSGAGRRIRP